MSAEPEKEVKLPETDDKHETDPTSETEDESFLKFPDEDAYGPGLTQVPRILFVVYGIVISYSVLAWLVSGCFLPAMVFHYHAVLVVLYLWHRQAHTKYRWNQECFRLHMAHHWQKYPPSKFFGEKPEEYKTMNVVFETAGFQHELLLYVGAIVSLVITKFVFQASWIHCAWAAAGYAMCAYVGNYFHNSFHVLNHPLNKFRWFHELRALHYIHHLGNAKHNYALINFTLDKLAGHYFTVDPVPKPKPDTALDGAPEPAPPLKKQISSEHFKILQEVPDGIDKGAVLGALKADASDAPPLTRQISAKLVRQLSSSQQTDNVQPI
jgi:hypothetical protein